MKLTTEQKLEKAIEFIRSIEKLSNDDYSIVDNFDIENSWSDVECLECGGSDVKVYWNAPNAKYIDAKVIEDLSDKAWHLLIDLTD